MVYQLAGRPFLIMGKAEIERRPGETDEQYAERMAIRERNHQAYLRKKSRVKPVLSVDKTLKRPGCKVKVESFDKHNTKAICVSFYFHLEPVKRVVVNVRKFQRLDADIRGLFYRWSKEQEEYEAYICVPKVGKTASIYEGKSSIVGIDLTLKLKNATVFGDALKTFESKLDSLYSSLKSLFDSNEMVLKL